MKIQKNKILGGGVDRKLSTSNNNNYENLKLNCSQSYFDKKNKLEYTKDNTLFQSNLIKLNKKCKNKNNYNNLIIRKNEEIKNNLNKGKTARIATIDFARFYRANNGDNMNKTKNTNLNLNKNVNYSSTKQKYFILKSAIMFLLWCFVVSFGFAIFNFNYTNNNQNLDAAGFGYSPNYEVLFDLNLDEYDASNLAGCTDSVEYIKDGKLESLTTSWDVYSYQMIKSPANEFISLGDKILSLTIHFDPFGEEVNITRIQKVTLEGLYNEIINKVNMNKRFVGFKVILPKTTSAQIVGTNENSILSNNVDELPYTGIDMADYSTYSYLIQAQWEEVPQDYNITLSNDGEGGISSLGIVNGVPTVTTITPPTKEGYRFLGYYKENNTTSQQYIDANGNVKQDSNLYSTPITTLYAQWEVVPEVTLTLNCTNYSNQNYFIYIYEGNELKSQMYVQGQATIKLAYSEQQYKLQFVLSYLGTVSYSVDGGSLQNNKTLVISEFKDTTISYQVFTSNINNSVII